MCGGVFGRLWCVWCLLFIVVDWVFCLVSCLVVCCLLWLFVFYLVYIWCGVGFNRGVIVGVGLCDIMVRYYGWGVLYCWLGVLARCLFGVGFAGLDWLCLVFGCDAFECGVCL